MERTSRLATVRRAAAIGAGTVVLGAIAGASPAIASSRSCYALQKVGGSGPGTTSFSSTGFGAFTESELDANGNRSVPLGPGRVHWVARGSVLGPNTVIGGGDISGTLVATFLFANGGTATFTSRCVAEVQTDSALDNPFNQGDAEMEAEGTVVGFPGTRRPTPAVASFSVSADGGAYSANFGIELGTTCLENGPGNPNQEFGGISVPATGLGTRTTVQNVSAGRLSFPNASCADSVQQQND